MTEFDESKILTAVTADQAKVGDVGWFGDSVDELRLAITSEMEKPSELKLIDSDSCQYRFSDGPEDYSLFYPAPYSYLQEQWVQENDLNVGDKVRIEHVWGDSKERAFQEPYITHYFYQVGRVIDIHPDRIVLQLKTTQASVPYFAIEKVKEPEYRPFASADEFKPHRDKWFIFKQSDVCVRFGVYTDELIYHGGEDDDEAIEYADLLRLYTFEDGTPAGVKV